MPIALPLRPLIRRGSSLISKAMLSATRDDGGTSLSAALAFAKLGAKRPVAAKSPIAPACCNRIRRVVVLISILPVAAHAASAVAGHTVAWPMISGRTVVRHMISGAIVVGHTVAG